MMHSTGKSCRLSGISRILLAAAALIPLLVAPALAANQLPLPQGRVLLVVKGAIANANVGAEAHLDREMLESIGFTKLVTRTPWTDGDTVFEGVLARDLIKAIGATGTAAKATAANDYSVTIPLADFTSYDVLLAISINGETISLRTKGPVWIIYPDGVDMAEQERRERMIWQLVELDIE